MGQKIASMIQTRRPKKQTRALSSTGSTGFQTHHHGGTAFRQKQGADGDHRDEVVIGREDVMHLQQQEFNTPPMPRHPTAYGIRTDHIPQQAFNTSPMPSDPTTYGIRTDHKQNNKADLNGKQAQEQRSVAEFQSQQEGYTTLRAQIDWLETENESLKRDLKVTEFELEDARNSSQIRAKELQGAQAFLNKADVLSTTDVVEKVNVLNKEISQAASLLVDLLHNAENHHRTQKQPTEMTEWMLGEKLARDLHGLLNNPTAMSRCREPNHWQLLFLVVFHIAITKWCSTMVNSWVPNDRALSDSITPIYSGIRQVGE